MHVHKVLEGLGIEKLEDALGYGKLKIMLKEKRQNTNERSDRNITTLHTIK